MIVAAGLHVAAVWNLDDASAVKATEQRAAAAVPVPTRVARIAQSPAPVLRENAAPLPAKPNVPAPATRSFRTLALNGGSDVALSRGEAASEPVPVLKAAPEPAKRPTAATAPAMVPALPERPVSSSPQPAPADAVAGSRIEPAAPLREAPKLTAVPKPMPQSAAPAAAASVDPIAELQRRIEATPMPVRGSQPRTLLEQIAELKQSRFKNLSAHSEDVTGFTLTGKHLKVDCASCHTAPFHEPIKHVCCTN